MDGKGEMRKEMTILADHFRGSAGVLPIDLGGKE